MLLSAVSDEIQAAGQSAVDVFIIGAKEAASYAPFCLATIWPKPIQRTNTRDMRRPVRAPAELANGTNIPKEKTPSRGPPTIPNRPIAA